MRKITIRNIYFMRRYTVLHFVVPAMLALSGCEKNYDECVLNSMKGVTSDMAARAIVRSCGKKYEEKKPKSTPLPAQAIVKLNGNAQIDEVGFIRGQIYNGNSTWTVTEFTIAVRYKNSDGMPTSREYKIDKYITPLSQDSFIQQSGPADTYTGFEWTFVTANGYQKGE